VRKQGQQLAPEILHLSFSLRTGAGRIRGELGAQSGVFSCKLIVQGTQSGILSREACNLLLCDPRPDLSVVPLLLTKLCPVAPKTDGSGLACVVHRRAAQLVNPQASATTFNRSPIGSTVFVMTPTVRATESDHLMTLPRPLARNTMMASVKARARTAWSKRQAMRS
jgi:hypothetical protein